VGATSGRRHPELGYPILDQFRVFPAAEVNAPVGVKAVDWIEGRPAGR
jgi:hypothetical protein